MHSSSYILSKWSATLLPVTQAVILIFDNFMGAQQLWPGAWKDVCSSLESTGSLIIEKEMSLMLPNFFSDLKWYQNMMD